MVTLSKCARCGKEFFADDPMDQICEPCLDMPGMKFVLTTVNMRYEEYYLNMTFPSFDEMMNFVKEHYPTYTSLLVSILPVGE